MKSFSNETLNFFLQKLLFLLQFGSCQNCMRPANLVAETHLKRCNKSICEYVAILQSFHRGILSIHCYLAQRFQPTFSMSVLFRRNFKTAILSRFLKLAIATSNFINNFYNAGFSSGFSVSMSKEIYIYTYLYKEVYIYMMYMYMHVYI